MDASRYFCKRGGGASPKIVPHKNHKRPYRTTYSTNTYSMCSLVVSVLDSPAVDPRSNPGSGSVLLMSKKSQAVYYISSCHMLIDKALSSDKPNGHWFEADWLHCKRDALSSNRKVDGSRLTGSTQAVQLGHQYRAS